MFFYEKKVKPKAPFILVLSIPDVKK